MPNIIYKMRKKKNPFRVVFPKRILFLFLFCIGLLPKNHSATRSKNGRCPRGAGTVIVSLPA